MSEKEKSTQNSLRLKSGKELLKEWRALPLSTDRIGQISVSFYSKAPKGIKSSPEKRSIDKNKDEGS